MRVVIIDNGTKHLQALLRLTKGQEVTVLHARDVRANAIPSNALVILSGAKHGQPSVQEGSQFYAEELKLIKAHRGPLLGICFGFELIAHAYGVTLHRRPRRIRRLVRVVASSLPVARFLPRQFTVYVAHKFSVKAINSNELIALARSRGGVEILRHRTRPVFGVQFHPEVRLQSNAGSDIFQRILNEMAK